MGEINLSAFTLLPSNQIETDTGTIRSYYDQSFLSEGVSVVGSPVFSDNFYNEFAWVTDGDGNLVAENSAIITTVNSSRPDATITLVVYDANGTSYPAVYVYNGPVPNSLGSTVTLEELQDYVDSLNVTPPTPRNSEWVDVVDSLIQTALGERNYADIATLGLIYTNVTPVPSNHPTAVIEGSRFLPDFFNITAYPYLASTSKTAAQNATAIAAARTAANLVGAAIYVPIGTFALNSVSITNVIFATGGILSPATGQTLTITGTITADNSQHFAGLGTISFTGNNVQMDYWVDWWGAIGNDSANDTAAITAAGVAWPNGTKLHLSPHKSYRHTPIVFTHKYNSQLVGIDTYMGYSDLTIRPSLVYNGVDGGTAITFENCLGTTWEGIGFYGAAAAGATGAAINILVSGVSGGTPSISSQNVIQGNLVRQVNTRSGWIGIKFTSSANNEQMRIFGNYIEGGVSASDITTNVGTGIQFNEVNQRAQVLRDNSFRTLAASIDCLGGVYRAYDSVHSAVTTLYKGVPTDAVEIMGDDVENYISILDLTIGNGGRYHILSGRYQDARDDLGSSVATPVFAVSNGAVLKLENNFFAARSAFGNNFALDENATCSLVMEHNVFSSVNGITWANLKTAIDTFNHRRSYGSIDVSGDETTAPPFFYQDGTMFFWGDGSPEGQRPATIGSVYYRTNGSAGTSIYFKESGTGNTGWVARNSYEVLTAGTSLSIAGGTALTTTNRTGTGNLVLASSPTIVTPTVASFTNATHDHSNAAGGGQIAVGTGISGLGTGVATFLGTPSSANLRAALSDESGTGAALFQGGNIGAATGTSLAATGALTSSGTAGVGYATGAGGAVSQITSKVTGVTLDKITGSITTFNDALGAGAEASFVVTNSTVAATDVPVLAIKSGGTLGAYAVVASAVAAGSFTITITNLTAGSLSEAIVIQFAVIKGISA